MEGEQSWTFFGSRNKIPQLNKPADILKEFLQVVVFLFRYLNDISVGLGRDCSPVSIINVLPTEVVINAVLKVVVQIGECVFLHVEKLQSHLNPLNRDQKNLHAN